jgi:hypothetical protein
MIQLLHSLFSAKHVSNKIADSIEIKEIPAKTWWS